MGPRAIVARMRRAPWLEALAGVFALATTARAQEQPVLAELEWQGGPSSSNCIEAQELEAAVETRLGRTLFAPKGQADVRLAGAISEADGKWLVRLTLTSAEGEPMGERDLESESADCSALDDSLATMRETSPPMP